MPAVCSVMSCARCGEDHSQVDFHPFERPCGQFTYWGICPKTKEPILMRFQITERNRRVTA